MNLPNDPVILLSYLNTQLRDHFSSLTELCLALGLTENELTRKLAAIDYHYDKQSNQFV